MKLMKLAVILGLAGSSLAMLTSPSQAFQLSLNSINKTGTGAGATVTYQYYLGLDSADSFNIDYPLTFAFKNLSINTVGSPTDDNTDFNQYFQGNYTGNITSSQATFKASKPSFYDDPKLNNDPGVPANTFVFNIIGKTNGSDIGIQACNGSICYDNPNGFKPGAIAPQSVPEAESALVPVLALGFGYLYRSKKRKKLQVVATPEQGRSLV